MYIKTKAIVLSSIKFKDADLIIKCYTKQKGSISFMVKGVLKSKKAKLRPAMFQTLNLLDIEYLHRDKNQLAYFKEVRVSKHLNGIHNDIYKSTMVMFISEILKSVIHEEEPYPELFYFLEKAIIHLENTKHFANFHISFLVNLLSFIGFAPHKPLLSNDFFFNLNEGHFESFESKYCMNSENSALFLEFLELPLKNSQNIRVSKKNRKELLHSILVYYQLHIENFQKPKSLEVIESIFRTG